MDLRSVIKVLLRLWPVALATLMATVAAAFYVGSRVAPTYEAEATLLVLSPAVTRDLEGEEVATNPFALSGPAERIVVTSVLAVTDSEQWVAAMEEAGAEGDYSYALSAEAPIVVVSSAADTPDGALHTVDVASGLFREELEDRQRTAGAPPNRLIDSEVLSSTQEPAVVIGSRMRAMVAVAALMETPAIITALLLAARGQKRETPVAGSERGELVRAQLW